MEELAERFHKALAARPKVLAAYTMTGEINQPLNVLAPDMEAFDEFATRALLRMPDVKETRSSFVLARLKAPGEVTV